MYGPNVKQRSFRLRRRTQNLLFPPLPTDQPVDLPIRVPAQRGAVVHLMARAATHLAGADLGAEAEGADALAGHLCDSVEHWGQGGRFRLAIMEVRSEHLDEHVAHEILVVHHFTEAELAPNPLAKDNAAIVEVGAHHSAKESAGVAREFWALHSITLLFVHWRELSVRVFPCCAGIRVPNRRVEGLERWRGVDLSSKEIDFDFHLDTVTFHARLGTVFGNYEPWIL